MTTEVITLRLTHPLMTTLGMLPVGTEMTVAWGIGARLLEMWGERIDDKREEAGKGKAADRGAAVPDGRDAPGNIVRPAAVSETGLDVSEDGQSED